MRAEVRTGQVTSPDWLAAWVSSRGAGRAENGDRAHVGAGFAVVADGVGGSPDGAGAADAAVRRFTEVVQELLAAGAAGTAQVERAVTEAHEALLERQRDGRLERGSATTLVAAVAVPGGVVVTSVGDSPAWAIGTSGVRRVNRPHRRWDPDRSRWVLVSALGVGESCTPESVVLAADEVVTVVLASDGVFGADDREPDLLGVVVPDADRPNVACRALAADAVARGAADDVTVAVVRPRPVPAGS